MAAPPGPPHPRQRPIGYRRCHLDSRGGDRPPVRVGALAPLAKPTGSGRAERRGEAAGRGAIRARHNRVGRHLEYGQGPQRARGAVPRSAGRHPQERLTAAAILDTGREAAGVCLLPSRKKSSAGDRSCSDASSLHMDLSKLVTWAHSHGAICNQVPAFEGVQGTGHPRKESSLLWMCGAGHAYYWPCRKLDGRSKEVNAGVRKRSASSETSSGTASSDEKRLRMTPSFGRAKASADSTGSCSSSSPGVTQRGDTVCVTHTASAAREAQTRSKPVRAHLAAEHHLPVSSGEVKAGRCEMKLESQENLQMISDEEQCFSGEEMGDTGSQNVLLECPEAVTAAVELQRYPSQRLAFDKPTAAQTSAFVPTEKPLLPPASSPKSSVPIKPESLDSSSLLLGPPNPEWSGTDTWRARNSSGSASPKEHFKRVDVPNAEAEAQCESPASVAFFAFEAMVDVKHQIQLSPPEHGPPGTSSDGAVAVEESEPQGSGPGSHPSTSMSLGSQDANHLPTSSSKSVLDKGEKKRSHKYRNIKVLQDWLLSHHPSETREIYQMPPEELSSYLASFYSSAKKQNGNDFSASSLNFFQLSTDRYLREHNYSYSVVKGEEFRAAQEALKLRQKQLSEKEREGEWSLVERLTEEDLATLRQKGLLSTRHPQGLLSLMLTNIIRGFGAQVHSQSHSLYWGQLVLTQAEGQLEYLEWRDSLSTEPSTEEPRPCLTARPHSPAGCPVQDYKEYAKRRPLDMLHDCDPLYLTPKSLCFIWDQAWFCSKSLSKANLEKLLKVIVEQVRRPGKKQKK
ncbi:uncharacterized protein KIAA1958-like [Indicator indicator]|uniref:uncharacterized protein KIAA1958-like n=1 Tax=Indicator indicator TaxID=1002788 RepID=UPI0023DEDC9E|nr:uncharacterized protein KIAA1958-like [Indicator indicator]